MQHFFDCDNCGKKIETYCFDNRDAIRFYYTPPMPDRIIDSNTVGMDNAEKALNEYMAELAARATTILCRDCFTQ